MAYGYADVPTRLKEQGALDKAVVMSAIADSLTEDRDFNELVSRTVAKAGNAADEQVQAWAEYVENLPYRRENGEVYRAWKEIVGFDTGVPTGGDCDDLTILLVAGLRSLGMQSIVELLTDEEGWGFHVRARVGLPPHAPTYWAVVDPVWRSEREWSMANKPLNESPLVVASEKQTQGLQSSFLILPSMDEELSMPSSTPLLLLGVGVTVGVLATKLWSKRKS
jgi:hypothetical protein